ncbi:transmembrane protease serine 9-like isoform X2 [Toxorhynchites rutilus septentrionalis]|uniref:transmembrane protease serine 9-like isoform X2 n=1 Tax=Toxorhynchites rutilus septentrionalis TaxID=329112 RepID=UPI00247AADFF|nr:transmembrane protease serine 9-like isoform X2 [Toxorhynchites rutilus septentrionalis]
MKTLIIATLMIVAACYGQQKTSPCPSVFLYDEKEDTSDTWYGTLRLKTNVPLHGIFIDVIFDGQIYVFGAYFKDVTTKDNLHFHIEDKSYQLKAGETLILKFYVKHSDYSRTPLLRQVRFNGQNVCVDVPTVRPNTIKPNTEGSYDRPVIYPQEPIKNENHRKTANKPGVNIPSVQPINPVVHLDTFDTNTPVYASSTGKSYDNSVSSNVKPNLIVNNSESQTDHLNVNRRMSETVSSEPSQNRRRPPLTSNESYDPIQDPTIWRKPTSSSSRETSTSRPVRQPVPGYESNEYANSRTPTPADDRYYDGGRKTTTEATVYFRGDHHQQRSKTTTEKPTFFQGDYAFIKNVETSTHYINAYDEDICGTIVPKTNPLITHGSSAQHAQFPWHGALYRSSVTELKYLCGTTLISERLSLTAAHCVAREKSRRPVESGSLLLYFGKTNLKQWNGPEQDAKVDQILINPDYNHERFFADIALLKLKGDVKFDALVRPVCLWSFDEDYKLLINKVGFVPGWGYTERGLVSEELSFAQMPVVAHETCIWSNRDFFSKVTSNTSFCAGFRNGTSVCNGDSGGGMVFKQGNRWFLRGIVSVSAALQNKVSCDPHHYAVFTDVAKFLRWIKSYM